MQSMLFFSIKSLPDTSQRGLESLYAANEIINVLVKGNYSGEVGSISPAITDCLSFQKILSIYIMTLTVVGVKYQPLQPFSKWNISYYSLLAQPDHYNLFLQSRFILASRKIVVIPS